MHLCLYITNETPQTPTVLVSAQAVLSGKKAVAKKTSSQSV